jgi:predicted molibdopterin-dependent oxidoreductase YjgC
VHVGVHHLSYGEDDNLLVRADKGANAQGARWIFGAAADARSIFGRVDRGEIDTLLVFGDALDPENTPGIDELRRPKLKQLVYVGPFLDEAARLASQALPSAAWSEEDGSFVNFEGRVQWTRRCHRPRGEGRPGWRVALDLATEAAVELPGWTSTPQVLETLAASVEHFKDLSESNLGLLGVRR